MAFGSRQTPSPDPLFGSSWKNVEEDRAMTLETDTPSNPQKRRSTRTRQPSRRSFGAVEVLSSGRWRARYTGPDGRMRSAPETFASRADADRWLTVIRADMLRGNWTAPEHSNVTLSDYTTGWLRQRTPQLRPRTLDLYQRLAARWILVPVGHGRESVDLAALPLRLISPALVREWHATVAREATASATTRATQARIVVAVTPFDGHLTRENVRYGKHASGVHS